MKNELEANLIKDFPDFFVDMYGDETKTSMSDGCRCGDGWYDLIYESCSKVKRILPKEDTFKFDQIKEKFGGLRLYYSFNRPPNSPTMPRLSGVSSATKSQIYQIICEVEGESYKTCENCGTKEDVTQNNTGWICTLCPNCRKKD